jgi:hypothetical protein
MMDFCGHPLTAWSIVQSVNSVEIDETYVSTDDEEIANMSQDYGAEIIWRDYEEASRAPANVPYCHAMRKLKAERDLTEVVCLLPTSPTRLPEDIDNIIRKRREMGFYEISVMLPHNEANESEIIGDHLCKAVLWDKTGRYVTGAGGTAVYDVNHYLETADFDIDFWTWEQMIELKQKNHAGANFFFRDVPYYPVKVWQQFDIDYKDEFELIQVLMNHYILKGKGIEIYEEYRKREEKRMENGTTSKRRTV